MTFASGRFFSTAVLSFGAAIGGSPALAMTCPAAGAADVTVGTVADVPAGTARSFVLTLGAGEGVMIDLASLAPTAAASVSDFKFIRFPLCVGAVDPRLPRSRQRPIYR